MTVLGADTWATNGDLIADVARLHLTDDMVTLDATYGRGIWWQQWRPHRLHTLDLVTDAEVRGDFRCLPFADDTFDLVAYDPPYAAHGGRATSTTKDYNERYGRHLAPMSAAGTQQLIDDGLTEALRVTRPGGLVLVKCASYVWSGKLWPGRQLTASHAFAAGAAIVDEFTHVGRIRPQPPRTRADGQPVRQHHARQNTSTLYVLRAPKAAPVTLFPAA